MTEHAYKCCAEPGCPRRTRNKYCPPHSERNSASRARAQRDRARKAGDKIWKLYNCVAWKRFRESCAAAGNAICQRIVDGQQCRQPIEMWHHIISPRSRPDLMYSYGNIVGVCRQHHPVTKGEPSENLGRITDLYVPTKPPMIKF